MVTNCMLNATFSKTIINASTSHFYESTGQEQPIDALHAIFIGIECICGVKVGIVLVLLDVIKQTLN